MSQALYRKYRSKSLQDVVGQDHITGILTNAIKSGRIAHAYLLTGPRGVGKTSIARILAHEINKLPYTDESSHLDIIEIDAASNNGVEDVRDLREKARLAPLSAPKKVYIIDEVHMLSKPAFNALLKTLEEPPEHIVFILATTDADKLPATIVSRTQQYSFRSIGTADLFSRLKYIAEQESINISDDALKIIAERGDGSFRDSISLLDQVSSIVSDNESITVEIIEQSLGLAPKKALHKIIDAVESKDFAKLIDEIQNIQSSGVSSTVIAKQMTEEVRLLLVKKPELINLLDGLIDVIKSSHPDIKLLSVLGKLTLGSQAPGPTQTEAPQKVSKPVKSVALAAPVKEVSASVESLKKDPIKPAISKKTENEAGESKPAQIVRTKPEGESKDFSWDGLVNYAKENYVALFSVISKCGYEIDGNTIKLYTGNAFYKRKLDDPKYSAHLYASLDANGGHDLEVETIPETTPIKDSEAAAVADIMGGGVEVKLDASV